MFPWFLANQTCTMERSGLIDNEMPNRGHQDSMNTKPPQSVVEAHVADDGAYGIQTKLCNRAVLIDKSK